MIQGLVFIPHSWSGPEFIQELQCYTSKKSQGIHHGYDTCKISDTGIYVCNKDGIIAAIKTYTCNIYMYIWHNCILQRGKISLLLYAQIMIIIADSDENWDKKD